MRSMVCILVVMQKKANNKNKKDNKKNLLLQFRKLKLKNNFLCFLFEEDNLFDGAKKNKEKEKEVHYLIKHLNRPDPPRGQDWRVLLLWFPPQTAEEEGGCMGPTSWMWTRVMCAFKIQAPHSDAPRGLEEGA